MILSLDIKQRRLELNLSQARLAQSSGLSLPLIQKIESGSANPSLKTLEALAETLGYRLSWLLQKAPWDELAMHGAPLSASDDTRLAQQPTLESLKKYFFLCFHDSLNSEKESSDEAFSRKREALAALVLALRDSFPGIWRKHFKTPLVEKLILPKPTGRVLKLKRIAKVNLAKYL